MAEQPSKRCACCGDTFFRRAKSSGAQWEKRAFCSPICSNRSKEPEPLHVRFWNNVVRADGCWLWVGTIDDKGYGKISHGGRAYKKDLKAHRLSYELRNGPIPDGMVICHRCDTPACVNPAHLYAGTQKQNMMDASARGRLNPNSRKNLRPGAKGALGAAARQGDRAWQGR